MRVWKMRERKKERKGRRAYHQRVGGSERASASRARTRTAQHSRAEKQSAAVLLLRMQMARGDLKENSEWIFNPPPILGAAAVVVVAPVAAEWQLRERHPSSGRPMGVKQPQKETFYSQIPLSAYSFPPFPSLPFPSLFLLTFL